MAKFLSRERPLYFLFIAFLYSILSTLQFGINKNHVCLRKVYLWSAQKQPNGRHCSSEPRCAELQHKSLLLAMALSHDRALSFPFTSFICTILSALQFGIKKNYVCLRNLCLWSAQKRPNGCHISTATQCVILKLERCGFVFVFESLLSSIILCFSF